MSEDVVCAEPICRARISATQLFCDAHRPRPCAQCGVSGHHTVCDACEEKRAAPSARPNLHVITNRKSNEALVEILENLLARAKVGEIIAGVFVGYTSAHATLHHCALGNRVTHEAMVGEMWLAQFTMMVETGRIVPPGSK